MKKICASCNTDYFSCQCRKTPDSNSQKSNMTCQWQDHLGRVCGRDYFINLPRPGISPQGLPSVFPHEWNKFCQEHYDLESPASEMDEVLDNHKIKLEARFDRFEAHRGKDMAQHCMMIIRAITGKSGSLLQINKAIARGMKG